MVDAFSTALEWAAAIRAKEVSPLEAADLYLERIDRLDPQLNSFCHRADDEVRAAAKAATDVVATTPTDDLPPFCGVPLPIKDLNDVEGWPTTHGSRGVSDEPAAANEPVVARFVDAGFVLLGKTTTPEFGTISFTESDRLGVTRNPWNTDHTPGGSSGGAGAALAAGLAPLVHGSDGGGSIRIPSSCNGHVGLKATRGRITNRTIDLEGLATSGVLARTVADAAAGLDVLARHDPNAWWSPPTTPPPGFASFQAAAQADPGRLRIAHLRFVPGDLTPLAPECLAAVDHALAQATELGHDVLDLPLALPSPDELVEAFGLIWNVGSAGEPVVDESLVEPLNQRLRADARQVDSLAYAQAVVVTQLLSRRITEPFGRDFDVLVTPTMACLPPLVESWRAGMDADPMMGMFNCFPMGIYTSMFNITGLPALSLPIAHDAATNLPIGVQFVAATWQEGLLFQLARQLEESVGWRDRPRPPVS